MDYLAIANSLPMWLAAGAAWMDIMNHLNVMVMNKNIRQFNIGRIHPGSYADLSNQSRKIERIRSQIEKEMGCPGILFDVTKNTAHYSSGKFSKLANQLKIEDFWDPSFQVTTESLHDPDRIRQRASDIHLDVSTHYYAMLMQPMNPQVTASAYRDEIHRALDGAFPHANVRMGFVGENSLFLLIPRDERDLDGQQLRSIGKHSLEIRDKLAAAIGDSRFVFGIADTPCPVFGIKKAYDHAKQTLAVGRHVYPQKGFLAYSELGVLAWIQIKEAELERMVNDMERVLHREEHRELVQTLKMYLGCKMNYSLTAKNMFIHINTVRKRIEQVNDLLGVDLEDPISRLKLELFLMLT